MRFTKNKIKILFILIFVLFFSPLIIQAMPKGTILYKTGENGKMYGRNDYYEFSLIPGKAHFGGVGIYIGKDKLTKEPMVVEVDYSGIRRIPAKYFVDLDKGEEFIGAKIPTRLIKFVKLGEMPKQIPKNIYFQEGEGFDFTYHKQKGPQSGDWTPAGFIEKIYESAESHQLAYHKTSIGDVLTYSINITHDGYDNESKVNKHHDVFSERFEYSKIHTLSQGDFWEQFFNKEVQDTFNLITNKAEQEQDRLEKDDMQKWEDELKGKPVKDKDIAEDYNYAANLKSFSKIAKGIKDIISVTIYGREYEKNRYFFFPYTQFKQKTLMDVDVDSSEVSSHGKAEAVGGLSLTQKRVMMTTAFFERLVYALAIEKGKEVVMNVLGIGKIISSINAVKASIGVGEEGARLLSGGKVDIDTEKMFKKTLSKNEYAQAALSFKQDADDFYQAGVNESLEFFDLVNKGHLKKGGEFQRTLDLELARISGEDEEIIDTRPVVRQLGDVIDITPIDIEKETEKELKKLENKKIKDKDLQKLKELIDDSSQDLENKPDEVEPHQQEQEIKEPIDEPLEGLTFQQGDVVINEFIADPVSGESEWIELYNKTDKSIDLPDWTIEDNTGPSFGSGSGKKSLKNTFISSKSFVVLIGGEHFKFNLNNSGDIIVLKHKDNIIDQVAYGNFDDGNINDNAPVPDKGKFLARASNSQDTNNDQNDWSITEISTYGLSNKISAPVVIKQTPVTSTQIFSGGTVDPGDQAYESSDILINEIMYNVSGADQSHEWLEIYNPGSSEVDLNGWKFYEAETHHGLILEQGSRILAAGTYAIIADVSDQFLIDYSSFSGTLFDSSFSLNNTSETIAIKDGQGNIINQITYLSEWGGDGDGNSIEKKSNGTWEQSSSEGGTPGQENSEQTYSASGEQESEDTTAPDITGLSNDTTPTKSKVWNWSSSDSTAQFRYIINQSSIWTPVGEYGGTKTATQNIGDGIYYLHVQAKDNLGNESEVTTISAVLDNTSPTIILSEKPSDPTNQTTTDITVSGDDVTHYKYKLDNGEYGNETVVATHIILSGLSDSEHTIYVIGRDGAGNWQEQANAASYIWTIESESEFSYSSDDAVINEIMYNPSGSDTGHEWIEIYNTINENIDLTNWKFYEAGTNHRLSLEQGSWILSVGGYAIIADNSTQFLIDYSSFSGTLFDSSFSLNNTSETIAIKDGQGNIINQITYLSEWGGDGDGNSIEKKSNGVWEQSLSEGGTPGQENSALQAVDTDSDGIVDTEDNCPDNANADQADEDNDGIGNVCDDDYEETPADTTPPTAQISEQPNNPTNETTTDITVSGDDVIFYKYKLDNGEYGNETVVATHIILSGLSDAEHTIYIIGKDTAGNWQEQTSATTYTWTIDVTGPSSSIIDPGDTFNESSWPVITGTASSDTSQVEIQAQQGTGTYYLDSNLVWQENDSSLWISNGVSLDTDNNTWSYSLPVAKLDEDNNYFFRSRAMDILGNIQASLAEIDFIFDKTPPGKVLNLDTQEQATPLDIRLSWDEINDNFSGINYYEIDWGSEIVTATNQLYNLTGTNRTTYPFKVRAVDEAGNVGEWSDIKSHPIDIESLVISEIQISGNKEFIELYNPTDDDIALDDWYFAYYSSTQDWDETPHRLKQFSDGAIIQSQGYYLIGVYDVSEFQADWQVKTNENQPYLSGQLSNTDGSIVIYSSSPSDKSSETLQKEYIDAVVWESVPDTVLFVKEGSTYDISSADLTDKSLERNINQDTDNNADDFFVQTSPNPQSVYGLWISGWNKRKVLVVDNKENANDLTNYQIKIDITYQAEMQSDFSDVRFTSSNGQSLLSYYREEYTENDSAVFWVKVPSLLAYSEVIIFQYYDNNTATYNGDGQNVFEFFDDFNDELENCRYAEYDYLNTTWSEIGYIKFYNPGSTDNGYISPKNLEMKNFYIKTKMYLEKETDQYLTNKANQAFIDYRHSDNNVVSTDSFDDDDYWKFGINNTITNNSYRGLRFDKNINTENLAQATNILKHDATMNSYFDKWGVYEARVYETNHQVDFTNEDLERTTWSVVTHYLNQTGRIYLRGLDISSTSWAKVDYLMIAQYTLPEPTILTDKSEGYTVATGQARNSYADFFNWGNRKTITITNVTNTTSTAPLVDYPVKIEMNYLTGMNTDFSDVRFTDFDGQTVLSYWNESYIASTSAVFWAKVPSILANGNKIIYMYYNNPSATYIGNGEDVFTLFDDFETYRHSEYDYFNANWLSKEGYVRFYSTGTTTNYGYLTPKDLQMKDLYIKARMKLTTVTAREANQAFVDYRYQDTNNYWRFGLDQRGSYKYRGINLESRENGTPFLEASYGEQFWDEWDTYEVWAAENNHKSRFVDTDGDEKIYWEKTTDTLNQTGNVYIRGSELESKEVYTFLDYLIIGQYKEPEPTVSISN